MKAEPNAGFGFFCWYTGWVRAVNFLPFDPNGRYTALAALQAETAVPDLNNHLAQFIQTDDEAWLIASEDALIGYATLSGVPGLPQVADANIWIRPARRRSGAGSLTLAHLANAARARGLPELSHSMTD